MVYLALSTQSSISLESQVEHVILTGKHPCAYVMFYFDIVHF